MWKDRAGELLMPLRGEWSECTLMLLMSEQSELRKLMSEQDEQYYYIDSIEPCERYRVYID